MRLAFQRKNLSADGKKPARYRCIEKERRSVTYTVLRVLLFISSFSFFFSAGQNLTTPYFLRRRTASATVRVCETSRSRSRDRGGRAPAIEGDK